jgi:hypothetical protein
MMIKELELLLLLEGERVLEAQDIVGGGVSVEECIILNLKIRGWDELEVSCVIIERRVGFMLVRGEDRREGSSGEFGRGRGLKIEEEVEFLSLGGSDDVADGLEIRSTREFKHLCNLLLFGNLLSSEHMIAGGLIDIDGDFVARERT